ncbi:MAG TPA: hypothetical protein VKS79_19825, partial [Gemmataceae bacterium]|nr:hypothetical protein [Gemmataceae bacterium]
RKIPSPSPFHPSPLQPHIDTAIMEPNSIETWCNSSKDLYEAFALPASLDMPYSDVAVAGANAGSAGLNSLPALARAASAAGTGNER